MEHMFCAEYKAPFGWIIPLWIERPRLLLVKIELLTDKKVKKDAILKTNNYPLVIKELFAFFDLYFKGRKDVKFSLTYLCLDGVTEFSRSVLLELKKVPFGDVISYKDLATATGYPKGCRAVGNVMNKNPFPIIFPCHRVIKSDGSLGGFAGGQKIKKYLLKHETKK